MRRPCLYIDIDDTLIRSVGSKRIPMTKMVALVRELCDRATLYAWSTVGADYARESATELGIADCFVSFLPKPDLMIDDAWRTRVIHPSEATLANEVLERTTEARR